MVTSALVKVPALTSACASYDTIVLFIGINGSMNNFKHPWNLTNAEKVL